MERLFIAATRVTWIAVIAIGLWALSKDTGNDVWVYLSIFWVTLKQGEVEARAFFGKGEGDGGEE